jgi:hypothetical protein
MKTVLGGYEVNISYEYITEIKNQYDIDIISLLDQGRKTKAYLCIINSTDEVTTQ